MAVYVYSLPFALLPLMHYLTPVACSFIAYVQFGIDEIAVEIEEPFGEDYNDLPLDDLTRAAARRL